MEVGQGEKFACEACGRQFAWNAKFAGKKVRCPCGQVMQYPAEIRQEEMHYDLAPQHIEAAAPPQRVEPLSYQAPAGLKDSIDDAKLKDFYAPLWMLGAGVVIDTLAMLIYVHMAPVRVMVELGIGIVRETVVMFAGVFIVARLQQIDLGKLHTALLKLCAITIAPGAVGMLIFVLSRLSAIGALYALIADFVLYFAFLGWLFDLDQEQTWACVLVIFVLNVAVRIGIWMLPWHLNF
jgi:hypothetical protein